MAEQTNLSGYWSGWYAYTGWTEHVPFTASLSVSGHSFTGTTLEPNSFGPPTIPELDATLTGTVHDMRVSFEKVYDSISGVHRLPIRYEGVLNNDCQFISGHWIIHNDGNYITGDFEMSRLVSAARAEDEATEVSVLPSTAPDEGL